MMVNRWFLLIFVGAMLGLAVSSGCGGRKGPARYDLSGTVTYDGKPVPIGYLNFTPDKAGGNSGPGTHANIENGQYQTPTDRGPVGGPHIVTINGFDGVAQGANPMGKRLFAPLQVNVDLPKQNGTHDFVVPVGQSPGK